MDGSVRKQCAALLTPAPLTGTNDRQLASIPLVWQDCEDTEKACAKPRQMRRSILRPRPFGGGLERMHGVLMTSSRVCRCQQPRTKIFTSPASAGLRSLLGCYAVRTDRGPTDAMLAMDRSAPIGFLLHTTLLRTARCTRRASWSTRQACERGARKRCFGSRAVRNHNQRHVPTGTTLSSSRTEGVCHRSAYLKAWRAQ